MIIRLLAAEPGLEKAPCVIYQDLAPLAWGGHQRKFLLLKVRMRVRKIRAEEHFLGPHNFQNGPRSEIRQSRRFDIKVIVSVDQSGRLLIAILAPMGQNKGDIPIAAKDGLPFARGATLLMRRVEKHREPFSDHERKEKVCSLSREMLGAGMQFDPHEPLASAPFKLRQGPSARPRVQPHKPDQIRLALQETDQSGISVLIGEARPGLIDGKQNGMADVAGAHDFAEPPNSKKGPVATPSHVDVEVGPDHEGFNG